MDRLLTWIRRGGLTSAEKRRREEETENERRERLKRLAERGEALPRVRAKRVADGFDLFSFLAEMAWKGFQWFV